MDAPDSTALHAAVLAAGPATRFGSPKQLVRLAGEPALHRAIANAAFVVGHSVTVVLGAHVREIAPSLRQSAASVVVNRQWEEGLASSIRTAVQSVPAGNDGLLLVLADQVAVTTDDLKRLYVAWRRHPVLVAAALYGGEPGLPAIFPRWAFGDLLQLRGDQDPRLAIRRNVDRLVRIPMPNAAIDIDTPEDLLRLEGAATDRPEPGSGL